MRKISLLLLTTIILPLAACGSNRHFEQKYNDDDLTIERKTYQFVNTTDEYDIATTSCDLYFASGNDVPYISVLDYLTSLDGLFDCGENLDSVANKEELTIAYTYSSSYLYYMKVNWYSNYVYFSSLDFPNAIVKDTGSTDYNAHFKLKSGRASTDPSVKIDLEAYYFDIYNYQGICLMPLSVLNILLGSPNYYNVIYNGDKIYGYYGEIGGTDAEYQSIYTSSLNNQTQSTAMRNASYHSLCLSIDYFYGLKTNKSISSYDNYISSTYKSLIMSDKASDNLKGYMGALVTQLDDLHTRLDSTSIYGSSSVVPTYTSKDISTNWTKFYSTRNTLNSYKNNRWTDGAEPNVRYCGDTAIIYLKSFLTGTNSQIYDDEGHVKADAYKYDTYWYMDKYLKEITNYGGINDVIIDVSTNGGGNVGAMLRAVGFLTNQDVPYNIMNSLTSRKSIYTYQVDTNNDDNYDDNDAFTNFRYTLLTSESSFSAANTFTSIFKQLSIGKTIGHRSGGGMCSVLPLVLADGTFFAISSTTTIRYVANGTNFISIEEGLEANKTIDYSKFYDDSYLVDTVDSIY